MAKGALRLGQRGLLAALSRFGRTRASAEAGEQTAKQALKQADEATTKALPGGNAANYGIQGGRAVWTGDGIGIADDLLKYAKNLVPKKGFTDVFIHGTKDSFHVLHNGKWVRLSHRDLASFLKSKGIKGNVRLISCNAGQGKVAQNLANKLGVTVEAATGKVGVSVGSKSPPLLEPGSNWIPFKPRRRP